MYCNEMAFATVSVLKIKSWRNNNGLPEGSLGVFFYIFAIFTEAQMQITEKRISPQRATKDVQYEKPMLKNVFFCV